MISPLNTTTPQMKQPDASSRDEIKADNSPSNVIEVNVPDFVGAHRSELFQLPTHGVMKAAFDTENQMDLS